jgi:outer membrane protein
MKALCFVRNALFLGVLFSGLAHAEDVKFAYAHLEKAINEVDDGVKAKMDLQKEMDQKKSFLEKKHKELQGLEEALKKQSAVMSQETRIAKAEEFQKKAAEFQQIYQTTEQDFMKRRNEVMAPIVQKMQTLVETMRVEGGYSMVFDQSQGAVIAGKPESNLTNELIRRYNLVHNKSGKAASAKK